MYCEKSNLANTNTEYVTISALVTAHEQLPATATVTVTGFQKKICHGHGHDHGFRNIISNVKRMTDEAEYEPFSEF